MEVSTVSVPSAVSNTLTSATLIGQVAALYLAQRLQGGEGETGTARFILDQLKGEQMAAIARAVLDHEYLAPRVKIQLPHSKVAPFAEEYSLPDTILTTQRATFLRNAHCERPALLLANTGDDEAQSLQLIEPIGSTALLNQAALWVEVAAQELELTQDQLEVWGRILRGLMELNIRSLPHIAEYVLRTRLEIAQEGLPLLPALGAALPALAIPRDTQLFLGLPEKFHTQGSRWKALFAEVQKKRAPYLRKITPGQTLLTAANLRNSFKNVRDAIPENHHETIEAFIASDGQWNEAAKDLAEFEWEVIKPLFDGLRREKLNLGQLTKGFYDDRDEDLLSHDERAYLTGLAKRNPSTATDEDRQFYELHRHQISDSRPLKAAWDKFAFGRPQENEDFLAGLALCLERLTVEDNSTNRILKIRLDAKTKGDFRKLNVEAGTYFASRYKGLPALLGSNIVWEVGELWNFPALVEEWKKQPKYSRNRSEAKAALQLKFTLELQMDSVTQTGQASGHTTSPTQLIWTFSPNKVTREFAGDWERLTSHPIVQCIVGRESVSAKGRFQAVNINDVRTLTPAFGQNRGSFVSTYKGAHNLATKWEANLKEARRDELISAAVEQEVKTLWSAFKTQYTQAIVDFWATGLASSYLLTQVQAYAALLTALCSKAVGDRNRTLLLQPLLRIGSVSVSGDTSTEIIAPWHPLRMAAMAIKAQRVGALIKDYLTKEEVRFGDAGRLFFKDLREELGHAFYPEVVLGRYESRPELLALVDTCGDYTLHESPVAGLTETSDNPTEASKRVAELVDRYLTLQPHESANLSVVLYNCDSARLPQAVVDRIGAMHEEDEDVRCQIVLRHNDPRKLHPLYERIVEASDTDPDAYSTSEATRDFMARLRIGISAEQAPAPNEQEGPPNDIVFLQDVIARHATVEWHKENAREVPLKDLVPAQWSRRRPAPTGDMKSVVYLCCPAQSAEGWAYLTAITTFLRGNWDGDTTQRLLPARQLDFQDPDMSKIFEDTHNLGNWVVNYDELLDRRQLIDRKIRVIRYKQSTTQGRSLIVSSTASLGLLRSMVQRRVGSLQLELPKEAQQKLTEQFIQEANKISGDIVLRAARRGRSASELMGVVLSSYLIRHEMQAYAGSTGGYFGWYFLDDYAEWLGQREEQLADILMLSPSRGEKGELRLTIIVSEAKFIDRGGLIAGARNSRNQLRDTIKRIHDALFETPARLDRTLWLARLSDLILDGVQFPAGANINLADWRMAIRRGECQISLRGYSHVFVSGPEEEPLDADFSTITEVDNAYQEVFSWDQVRDLVTLYAKEGDPMPLRRLNGEAAIWEAQTFVQPPGSLESVPAVTVVAASPASLPAPSESVGVPQPDTASSGSDESLPPQIIAENAAATSVAAKWAYPAIQKLLPAGNVVKPEDAADVAWLSAIGQRTKAALQGFNLQAKLLESKLTPNAALLTFQGSANLTVDQVLKKQVEFKTTYGLSVVSVRPEAGAISLAIERPQRQLVRLEDIWGQWQPSAENGNQDLAIAIREDNGEILMLSPQKNAPHSLIAGSTGSGKSVLVQNIILCIAATNTPAQAQIVLIDPKLGVDYFALEPLPHIKGGRIIDEREQALEELNLLVDEMEARYKRFKEARTANITAYNKKIEATERLPVIWLIHDEFADWMQVEEYKQQVTAIVARLGVKARAAGIYLVFAAQRPDANVMPMQLRANLGNRLILRVDSEGTSEIALNSKGAERLLGKGHLLARLEGLNDLVFGQVPFLQDEVIEELVQIIAS